MNCKTYINLFFLNVIFSQEIALEASNLFDNAVQMRKDGNTEESLKYLHKIENIHLESNYLIAEIYLNEIKNPNIALDYYIKVLDSTSNYLDDKNEMSKNLYRKSLFMISYIYSNYLGMYSEAIQNYKLFLELFQNDELSESVKYELGLLEPFETQKKQLIGKNNG